MESERRNEGNPFPKRHEKILNKEQLLALRRMEEFGWGLKFIRMPLFQNAIPVLFHPDHNIQATLEDDGYLNKQPNIKVRADDGYKDMV